MADGSVILEIDLQDDKFKAKLQALGAEAQSLTGGALASLDRWLEENRLQTLAWSQAAENAATAVRALASSAVSVISGADLQQAAAKAASGIPAGIRRQTGTVRAASAGLIMGVTSLWSAAAGQFQMAGQSAGGRINSGLLGARAGISATARGLASDVAVSFTGASDAYSAAGLSAARSLAGGLAAGQSGIVQTAMAGARSGYGAVGSLNWYSLGYNISAGIASGVRGGSYLITSAARAAAKSALGSAKSALGIHSPSRVFRDEVGRQIPSGIALGIERATPEAQAAIRVSADELLSSARAAVRPTMDSAAQSYVTQNTVYQKGGPESLRVTVPLTVDGREFARATAKYTGRQMAYLEV